MKRGMAEGDPRGRCDFGSSVRGGATLASSGSEMLSVSGDAISRFLLFKKYICSEKRKEATQMKKFRTEQVEMIRKTRRRVPITDWFCTGPINM